MNSLAMKIYFGILLLSIVLILAIDFFPTWGPPEFRYTGSDPSRNVWNIGYPLALMIYDSKVTPSFVFGPFAVLVLPVQIFIVALIAVAPVIVRVFKSVARKGKDSTVKPHSAG